MLWGQSLHKLVMLWGQMNHTWGSDARGRICFGVRHAQGILQGDGEGCANNIIPEASDSILDKKDGNPSVESVFVVLALELSLLGAPTHKVVHSCAHAVPQNPKGAIWPRCVVVSSALYFHPTSVWANCGWSHAVSLAFCHDPEKQFNISS